MKTGGYIDNFMSILDCFTLFAMTYLTMFIDYFPFILLIIFFIPRQETSFERQPPGWCH